MKFEFLTRSNISALHTLCTGDRPEFASANAKRERWLDEMFNKGLRGWIALENGKPAGYVEYLPVTAAPFPVEGQQANFLTCLWVLPEYRHLGTGGSLLAACVGDSPQGVAAIGYEGDHMPVDFFAHFGFRVADRSNGAILLVHGPEEIRLLRNFYRAHETSSRLAIDVMYNPECPWSSLTAERVVAAVEQHPARAEIDLWVGETWACGTHLGMHGGIYLNGAQAFATPPSEAEVALAIENALTVRVPSDI